MQPKWILLGMFYPDPLCSKSLSIGCNSQYLPDFESDEDSESEELLLLLLEEEEEEEEEESLFFFLFSFLFLLFAPPPLSLSLLSLAFLLFFFFFSCSSSLKKKKIEINNNNKKKREIYSMKKKMTIWVSKLATVVEGDPKAPFSIATTLRCKGGRYSFPRIFPLYSWYITL